MGPKVQLIDSGQSAYGTSQSYLIILKSIVVADAGPLNHRFYTTASSQSFAQIGEEWLEKKFMWSIVEL